MTRFTLALMAGPSLRKYARIPTVKKLTQRPAANVIWLHQIDYAGAENRAQRHSRSHASWQNLPGSLLQSTKVSSDRQLRASCWLAPLPVRLARKVSLATQAASFPPSWWVARPCTKMESPRHFWSLLDCRKVQNPRFQLRQQKWTARDCRLD